MSSDREPRGPEALHFSLPVTDLARALHLYQDVFGLRPEVALAGFEGSLLNLSGRSGGRLSLRLVDENSESLDRTSSPRIRSRHVGLAFADADELESVVERARERGLIQLVDDDRSDEQELSRFAIDPDRNIIELYAPRPTDAYMLDCQDLGKMLEAWNTPAGIGERGITSYMATDVLFRHYSRRFESRGRTVLQRYDRQFLSEFPNAYKTDVVVETCGPNFAVRFLLHRSHDLAPWRVSELLERPSLTSPINVVSRIVEQE